MLDEAEAQLLLHRLHEPLAAQEDGARVVQDVEEQLQRQHLRLHLEGVVCRVVGDRLVAEGREGVEQQVGVLLVLVLEHHLVRVRLRHRATRAPVRQRKRAPPPQARRDHALRADGRRVVPGPCASARARVPRRHLRRLLVLLRRRSRDVACLHSQTLRQRCVEVEVFVVLVFVSGAVAVAVALAVAVAVTVGLTRRHVSVARSSVAHNVRDDAADDLAAHKRLHALAVALVAARLRLDGAVQVVRGLVRHVLGARRHNFLLGRQSLGLHAPEHAVDHVRQRSVRRVLVLVVVRLHVRVERVAHGHDERRAVHAAGRVGHGGEQRLDDLQLHAVVQEGCVEADARHHVVDQLPLLRLALRLRGHLAAGTGGRGRQRGGAVGPRLHELHPLGVDALELRRDPPHVARDERVLHQLLQAPDGHLDGLCVLRLDGDPERDKAHGHDGGRARRGVPAVLEKAEGVRARVLDILVPLLPGAALHDELERPCDERVPRSRVAARGRSSRRLGRHGPLSVLKKTINTNKTNKGGGGGRVYCAGACVCRSLQ
eukprot:Rhum_TRINITY_DN14261_c0_g1::Rhum_TRINITY_DN14261_c0_g1_i1::g.77557::m.77557